METEKMMSEVAEQQQQQQVNSNTNVTSADNRANQLENIKVAVRLRPFTEKEKQKASNRRIIDIEQNTAILYSPKVNNESNPKKFTFDYSYWSHDGFKRDHNGVNVPDPDHPNGNKYVSQEKVFEDLGQFLLSNALEGYNSALLAYGQTGSGKSYTVTGYGRNEGIVPRFARALFEELDKKARTATSESASSNVIEDIEKKTPNDEIAAQYDEQQKATTQNRYEVYFSMLEIYNEVVRDLLAKNHGHLVTQSTFARRGLKVREHPKHGFFVENLTSYACPDKNEIERRIEEGQLNKSIAATSMNETSSRGHTIYEFKIKQYKLKSASNPLDETLTTSVVQLVDLAGSERLAVQVIGQLGGDSFIASRASSPYPRSAKSSAGTTVSTGAGAITASGSGSLWSKASEPNRAPSTGGSRRKGAEGQAGSIVGGINSCSSNGNSNATMQSHDHHQRFKESVSINQSLSALGNCIQVLSQYSQQIESGSSGSKKAPPKIPYRDSMLTKLLNRCCLSGNSKVVIIATLSPAEVNYDDTLCTLRFADRAKQIRTHATINRMSRSEVVDNLQKENKRLKQIVDGRVTRSDDSSQTSNFDDSENVMENFAGTKIRKSRGTTNDDAASGPSQRGRTTVRKSRNDKFQESRTKSLAKSGQKLSASSSNPSLQIKEQMKRLVSPASRKMLDTRNGQLFKSKSMAQGLEQQNGSLDDDGEEDDTNFDEYDLNELVDIKEGIISPESDEDSSVALTLEEMTEEEKIEMFNKMLSNSMNKKAINQSDISNRSDSPAADKSKTDRPKRGAIGRKNGGSLRHSQVSRLSENLKKSNPYISNLNPDEQLTGVISYIIKRGETILGKSADCDIVLHGTELKSRHARLTRQQSANGRTNEVYIEPYLQQDGSSNKKNDDDNSDTNGRGKSVALMVNGSPVTKNTMLHNGDRLVFGTNAYFVYIDHSSASSVNLDSITFDMANNEVLRNVMSEEKNEAVIKEIKDYSHRPGTGKGHRSLKRGESKLESGSRRRESKDQQVALANHQPNESISTSKREHELESTARPPKTDTGKGDETSSEDDFMAQEAKYRDQLIEDTYEYAMPVAEANAVAKEMGVRVTYELKILTGEEQLPSQNSSADGSFFGSNTSDGISSSSIGDDKDMKGQNDRVTHITKLDALDVPPALFIRVHLNEQNIEFYWSKEKFQARRFKILELYGAWDVGGKSGLVEHLVDLSKVQGHYLIDPFVDDASSTPVLIGHAQVTLGPLLSLTAVDQSFDIVNMNDEPSGTMHIQAIPCHSEELSPPGREIAESESDTVFFEPYKTYSVDDLKKENNHDPNQLLGKKLVFMLKIISCGDIPDKFAQIHCQYLLQTDRSIVRTKVLRELDSLAELSEIENSTDAKESPSALLFNHSHYICIEKVTQEILDFFDYGFLTIQVVGHQRLSETTNKSPTVVSTIINSINKYKYKLEQQGRQYNGSEYSPSTFYSGSARSHAHVTGSNNTGNNSGTSSVASASTTANMLFDQQDDEVSNPINGLGQENVIDMILTKRKLERAENQLHYLKRTINIAEHYNKKHIPLKTVKKLLDSQGQELDTGSLEEMAAEVTIKSKGTTNKNSACLII